MAPWQEDLSAGSGLWRSIFWAEFTTVRTAILMPILVLYLLVLMRLVSVRGDSESTLLNRIGLTAFGAFIATAPLRASTPLVTAVVGITTLSLMNLLLNGLNYAGILPSILLAPKPTLLVAHGVSCGVGQGRVGKDISSPLAWVHTCAISFASTSACSCCCLLCVPAGRLLLSQCRKVFMTPEKVQSQLRKAGYASLEAVLAAVMEPDGRCSVIPYGRWCHCVGRSGGLAQPQQKARVCTCVQLLR